MQHQFLLILGFPPLKLDKVNLAESQQFFYGPEVLTLSGFHCNLLTFTTFTHCIKEYEDDFKAVSIPTAEAVFDIPLNVWLPRANIALGAVCTRQIR